jgi:hypothetical protein
MFDEHIVNECSHSSDEHTIAECSHPCDEHIVDEFSRSFNVVCMSHIGVDEAEQESAATSIDVGKLIVR